MTIDEIKKALARRGTLYQTQKKDFESESYIGKVSIKGQRETLPLDQEGNDMFPLATLFLEDAPFIPPALEGIVLITIYCSYSYTEHLIEEDLSPCFSIQTYTSLEGLIRCDRTSSYLKPRPLQMVEVANDYPVWDGGGIPLEIEDIICEMEEQEEVEYYEDIYEESYTCHKIGGYPSLCQPGVSVEAGYEFVLQIASDEKAKFNIVDQGNFYFYYHKQLKTWIVQCDFL